MENSLELSHHGFTELTQIDTFYNGLNDNDQDSLNAAAGENLLSETTREALNIIENKSKVRYSRNKPNASRINTTSRESVSKTDERIDKLADQLSTLVEIVSKKVVTPAPVKAVEESCVTCGGAYSCNTIPNPKGEMKAITTRSGVAYEGPSIPTNPSPKKIVERETEETMDKEQTNFQGSTAQIPPPVIPISILEPDVPKKFSAMLLKKLPEKLGDPDKFLIPCNFPGMDDSFKKFTDEPALVCLPPPEDANDKKEKQEVKNLAEPTAKRQTLPEEECPIPRESEDTSRSDSKNVLPSCDDFSSINVPRDDSVTFSNPLFEFDVNFNSSDINPLFDEVLEDIGCKDSYDSNLDESTFLVTPLSDSNKDECLTPRDDIEFLLHHDPSTPLKSVPSILEGFIDDLPFEENDDLFDLECKTNDWKRILYDAPIGKRSIYFPDQMIRYHRKAQGLYQSNVITMRKFIFRSLENFHTIIESLPTSTTLIEDSDSNREEIDIFSGPDDSIPPGIKSDFDLEEDIIDNLLNDDPIPEYERLTFDIEPDVPVINNVDELNEDECFDPGGGKINVEVDDSFTFVTRTFLPYLTYPEVSLLLPSSKNEDTIFDPIIST
ncbi:hypothetical protein Tco_0633060 [Tanacetum coccineum]